MQITKLKLHHFRRQSRGKEISFLESQCLHDTHWTNFSDIVDAVCYALFGSYESSDSKMNYGGNEDYYCVSLFIKHKGKEYEFLRTAPASAEKEESKQKGFFIYEICNGQRGKPFCDRDVRKLREEIIGCSKTEFLRTYVFKGVGNTIYDGKEAKAQTVFRRFLYTEGYYRFVSNLVGKKKHLKRNYLMCLHEIQKNIAKIERKNIWIKEFEFENEPLQLASFNHIEFVDSKLQLMDKWIKKFDSEIAGFHRMIENIKISSKAIHTKYDTRGRVGNDVKQERQTISANLEKGVLEQIVSLLYMLEHAQTVSKRLRKTIENVAVSHRELSERHVLTRTPETNIKSLREKEYQFLNCPSKKETIRRIGETSFEAFSLLFLDTCLEGDNFQPKNRWQARIQNKSTSAKENVDIMASRRLGGITDVFFDVPEDTPLRFFFEKLDEPLENYISNFIFGFSKSDTDKAEEYIKNVIENPSEFLLANYFEKIRKFIADLAINIEVAERCLREKRNGYIIATKAVLQDEENFILSKLPTDSLLKQLDIQDKDLNRITEICKEIKQTQRGLSEEEGRRLLESINAFGKQWEEYLQESRKQLYREKRILQSKKFELTLCYRKIHEGAAKLAELRDRYARAHAILIDMVGANKNFDYIQRQTKINVEIREQRRRLKPVLEDANRIIRNITGREVKLILFYTDEEKPNDLSIGFTYQTLGRMSMNCMVTEMLEIAQFALVLALIRDAKKQNPDFEKVTIFLDSCLDHVQERQMRRIAEEMEKEKDIVVFIGLPGNSSWATVTKSKFPYWNRTWKGNNGSDDKLG